MEALSLTQIISLVGLVLCYIATACVIFTMFFEPYDNLEDRYLKGLIAALFPLSIVAASLGVVAIAASKVHEKILELVKNRKQKAKRKTVKYQGAILK